MLMTGIGQVAIVPLLPALAHRFTLSDPEVALLLALPSLATLVASVPAGLLGDHVGPRRVTIGASVVLALSFFAQGSPSLLVFLAGRLGFGAAYAAIWTTGLTWLASFESSDQSRRLAATVTVSSIGTALGPVSAGLLAAWINLSLPFLVLGVMGGLVSAALLRLPPATMRPVPEPDGVRLRVRRGGEPSALAVPADGRRWRGGLVVAILGLVASAAVASSVNLLVPLQLARLGASSAMIGVVLSAAGAGYAFVSALVSRMGSRVATTRIAVMSMAGLAVAFVPVIVGSGALWVIATVMAIVGPRATIGTTAYPLGLCGATAAQVGPSLAMGAMNGLWATSMVVTPLLTGAMVGGNGFRLAYLLVAFAVGSAAIGGAWNMQ